MWFPLCICFCLPFPVAAGANSPIMQVKATVWYMLLTSLSSRDKVCTLEHISRKNSPRVEEKSPVPYKTLSLPIYLNSCDIATVAGNKTSQGRELNSPLLHCLFTLQSAGA